MIENLNKATARCRDGSAYPIAAFGHNRTRGRSAHVGNGRGGGRRLRAGAAACRARRCRTGGAVPVRSRTGALRQGCGPPISTTLTRLDGLRELPLAVLHERVVAAQQG